ncbi:MAG: hypothetical protein GY810_12520 [Aureispira sp.]|nr:hypothetical protein [Aureispira sp.]
MTLKFYAHSNSSSSFGEIEYSLVSKELNIQESDTVTFYDQSVTIKDLIVTYKFTASLSPNQTIIVRGYVGLEKKGKYWGKRNISGAYTFETIKIWKGFPKRKRFKVGGFLPYFIRERMANYVKVDLWLKNMTPY